MPIIIIYKNSDFCFVPVIFTDINLAFNTALNYIKHLAIEKCDDELLEELTNLEDVMCMNDLMTLIEDYDIEEIQIMKAYYENPKELN